eukprot:147900_1
MKTSTNNVVRILKDNYIIFEDLIPDNIDRQKIIEWIHINGEQIRKMNINDFVKNILQYLNITCTKTRERILKSLYYRICDKIYDNIICYKCGNAKLRYSKALNAYKCSICGYSINPMKAKEKRFIGNDTKYEYKSVKNNSADDDIVLILKEDDYVIFEDLIRDSINQQIVIDCICDNNWNGKQIKEIGMNQFVEKISKCLKNAAIKNQLKLLYYRICDRICSDNAFKTNSTATNKNSSKRSNRSKSQLMLSNDKYSNLLPIDMDENKTYPQPQFEPNKIPKIGDDVADRGRETNNPMHIYRPSFYTGIYGSYCLTKSSLLTVDRRKYNALPYFDIYRPSFFNGAYGSYCMTKFSSFQLPKSGTNIIKTDITNVS